MLIRLAIFVILSWVACGISPASADQTGSYNTYVASNGSGTACTLASPCASLYAALQKTATGGTITCLSTPTALNGFTITISVSIDCAVVDAYLVIELPASDSLQTVRLRNLSLNGSSGSCANGFLDIRAAQTVILQNVTMDVCRNHSAISDSRTTQSTLIIEDSLIQRITGPGIVVAGTNINATLSNVTPVGNTFGIAVAAGNHVTITRSVFSGNATGIEADGGSFVVVDSSTITNNVIGIQSGSAIRLSNNNITFNSTAINGATGTFGNNRFSGNINSGTQLTPVGASSTDLAQQ